jgi:hypothetical protein
MAARKGLPCEASPIASLFVLKWSAGDIRHLSSAYSREAASRFIGSFCRQRLKDNRSL